MPLTFNANCLSAFLSQLFEHDHMGGWRGGIIDWHQVFNFGHNIEVVDHQPEMSVVKHSEWSRRVSCQSADSLRPRHPVSDVFTDVWYVSVCLRGDNSDAHIKPQWCILLGWNINFLHIVFPLLLLTQVESVCPSTWCMSTLGPVRLLSFCLL